MGFFKSKKFEGKTAKEWCNLGSKTDSLKKKVMCYSKAIKADSKYILAWNNKGDALKDLEFFKEAIVCYDKVLELDPKYKSAWFNKGSALHDLGRYDEAIGCYNKVLELDPKHIFSWNYKGIALHDLNRQEEAIKCYDKTLEIDPKHLVAFYNKGIALGDLGHYDEAIRCYDRAIELDLGNIFVWNNKGVTLKNLSRYGEAIKCFDKVLEIAPEYSSAWTNRGNVFSGLDNHEEAIKCFSRVLELDPNDEAIWNNKGFELSRLSRHEEAIDCFDRAIKLNPKNANAWNNKEFSLNCLDRYEEAIECSDRALEINPDDTYALYNKGVALGSLCRYEESIDCFDKVLKSENADPLVWYQKGISLGGSGQCEEAIKCFDRVLELDPKYLPAWIYKGNALRDLDRYEEAISCYDRALELGIENANTWLNKGIALGNLGRPEEAIDCYNKVLYLDPENTFTWIYKGIELGALGHYDEAIGCCDKALELDFGNAFAWNCKGALLEPLGRHGEAVYCFDKVIRIDPEYEDAWHHKGNALVNLDKYEEAISCFEKAVKLDSSYTNARENLEFTKKEVTQKFSVINDKMVNDDYSGKSWVLDKSKSNQDILYGLWIHENVQKEGVYLKHLGDFAEKNKHKLNSRSGLISNSGLNYAVLKFILEHCTPVNWSNEIVEEFEKAKNPTKGNYGIWRKYLNFKVNVQTEEMAPIKQEEEEMGMCPINPLIFNHKNSTGNELNYETLREHLINVAKKKCTATYGETLNYFGRQFNLKNLNYLINLLDEISQNDYEENQPFLASLVVNKEHKIPGKGFYDKWMKIRGYTGVYPELDSKEYHNEEINHVWKFWSLQEVGDKPDEIIIVDNEITGDSEKRHAKEFPPELKEYYVESQVIGQGGFARVFKARKKDNSFVALKVPLFFDKEVGKSFINELVTWTKLEHDNIVRTYEYNILPIPYFEIELCECALSDEKLPMDLEVAANYMFNICEGLKYAHSMSILHMDLKPQNILLKEGIPKISDWGLSKVVKESKSSSTGKYTLYYAAPEQIAKKFGKKNAKTDIWQLGITFYELVTGCLPFVGDDPAEIMFNIMMNEPKPLSQINSRAVVFNSIIMKCLEKNQANRYQSISAIQKDLAEFLEVEYNESMKASNLQNDYNRSGYFCGELLLVNLKIGDLVNSYTYATDILHYANGEIKYMAEEISSQLKYRIDNGILEIPEELVKKAEFIAHKVRVDFGK